MEIINQLFDNKTGSLVSSVFDCMDYAEKEIKRGMRRYRNKKDEIDKSFMLLSPANLPDLVMQNEKLYRAHCREIITTIGKGNKPSRATNAVALCVLSGLSLKAPLRHRYYKTMMYLFHEIFDGVISSNVSEDVERYKTRKTDMSEINEIITEIKTQFERSLRK